MSKNSAAGVNPRKLAIDLLMANGESEVINILKEAGYWDDRAFWRLYGDKEGNFAQTGNQQALGEAALVEKIVNCCDSRLLCECVLRGIEPEGPNAPSSVRDAVAMFFEDRRVTDGQAGTLVEWSKSKRTDQSRFITISATGDRPTRGKKTRHMCLTIADQAEGQSPLRLPKTILSLNEKNKQRIRFVQGKFNMGGSGALRFCGNSGLQLIISRRHPDIAKLERKNDPTIDRWAITVVRREEPTNKSGDPIHSEFTYLAPINAHETERRGEVLSFEADTLPLMPQGNDAYKREVAWGTAIKLYEYETLVGQSNVLMKDGLLYALERLLPEIALPVRIHECRGYEGKEGSFETPISGLVVRLEDGKGDNLEAGFPISANLQALGMRMTAKIYAFKEKQAETYLHDEGVIFTLNGQAHGYLPKSLFSRPRSVGLPRLKDSLLVLVDCSTLTATQREDLFMSSRDRLSKKPIRYAVEKEIEALLKDDPELKRLQQERRERDVETKLDDDRPLAEVLRRILASSPALRSLFLQGQRLSRPFASGAGRGRGSSKGAEKGEQSFQGKRHPTYFRIPDVADGKVYKRHCEQGRRCRVDFATDVQNDYFDRAMEKGMFELEIVDAPREVASPNYSLTLEDGVAYLNMSLPAGAEIGDTIVLQATIRDQTLIEPFVSVFELVIDEQQVHQASTKRPKKPEGHSGGEGSEDSPLGITLPVPVPVREQDENWVRYDFDTQTACHVISDPVEMNGKTVLDHRFFINIDNASIKTEMKYSRQDSKIIEAKFKYANILIGLAILHHSENAKRPDQQDDESENESPQDTIRRISSALAPVIIPLIDQLSGLSEESFDEQSVRGEDL